MPEPTTETPLAVSAARAKQGDPEGFRRVVEQTHAAVFRLAQAVLGDPDEAQDVVQETYLRAWGRMDELREPAAVLGWLGRIARNLAHERVRWWRRRRQTSMDEALEPLARALAWTREQPTPDEALALAQQGEAVRRAVAALSEKHRVVLLLREVDGMSYEEIAQVIGKPVGTVESRLHRARQALAGRLRRLMRNEEEDA